MELFFDEPELTRPTSVAYIGKSLQILLKLKGRVQITYTPHAAAANKGRRKMSLSLGCSIVWVASYFGFI